MALRLTQKHSSSYFCIPVPDIFPASTYYYRDFRRNFKDINKQKYHRCTQTEFYTFRRSLMGLASWHSMLSFWESSIPFGQQCESWLLHFWSSSALTHLEPLRQCGRPRWSFWLLPLKWLNHDSSSHLGSEQRRGRSFSLACLSLWNTTFKHYFQTHNLFLKDNFCCIFFFIPD